MNWGVYLAHGCGVVYQSEVIDSVTTIPYHQMQEQQYDDDDDVIATSHFHNIDDNIYNNNYQKLINRLENALKYMGLTRFSYTVAIQYIISKIESGQHQKIQHVILYLISLLNNKNNNNNKKLTSTTNSRLATHHVIINNIINNDNNDINSTTSNNNNVEEEEVSNNRCPQLIPGLTAKPFWDPNQFEWTAILEASCNDIKKEFMALRPTPPPLPSSPSSHYQQQTQQQQQQHQHHNHSNINDNTKNENRNILSSGFQHYRSPKPTINANIDNTSTTTSTTDTTTTTTTCPLSNRSMHATDNNNSNSNSHHNNIDDLGTVATDSGHWNVCYFYLHDMDYHENLRRCPITAQSINSIPRHYHHALFSALAPNTHIIPHYGPTNKKLRIHLPLFVPTIDNNTNDDNNDDDHMTVNKKIPKNPWIRVGNEYKLFNEGKCIIFDDSFEHEVYNTSLLYPRIILIIDIWHPDLTNEEVHFFNFLNKLQIKAAKKISHLLNSTNKSENNINQNDDKKGNDDIFLDHHHQCKTSSNSINTNIKMHDNDKRSQEDFYHVIKTGKEKGIDESDINNIWM